MRRRVGLAPVAILLLFVYCSEATNFVLNINGKKPILRSADRFLSITIDPIKLLNANEQPGKLQRSIILARALSPAYVRFECPSCDSFQRNHELPQQDSSSPRNFTFSETQWSNLHEWSKTAGLDAVACIPPEMINDGKQPAVDLISLSDRMGYNSGWQLGNECRSRSEMTGSELAKKVVRLRDALNGFPRYSDSIIIGPDIVECWKEGQRSFLEDYFTKAGHALTAITWHPDSSQLYTKENETTPPVDDLADQKLQLDNILSKSTQRLPVWIAESGPEAEKKEEEKEGGGRGQYLGALFWARRLGSAAKLDVQVLMRQPADLFEPTPEYWVSLMHKMLVGPEVLGTRIEIKNDSDVYFYTQCTKSSEKYRRGAVTIFGVNLSPKKAIGKLQGVQGTTIHKYILAPGSEKSNILSATTIKLNRVPLKLTYDEKIPAIDPVIITKDKGFNVRLPAYSIGFWVVPDANMKACMRDEKEVLNKYFGSHQTSAKINVIKENENFNDVFDSINSPEYKDSNTKKTLRKPRDLSGIENGRTRKSGKKHAEKEVRRLENYLKRRNNNQRRPGKNPRRGSIKSFDHFKEVVESRQNKRPRRSPIKPILAESFNARRDAALKSRTRLEGEREKRLERRNKERQREHMPAHVEKNNKDNDFYGFFKQEPVDTFPKNDVYLTTGDSTEDNDYDYVKDEDEPKDEQRKPNPGHVADQDDTWVEDGNDFRGYVPNEFFENSKIHSVRVQNVKDFSELWEADCDCKNAEQDDLEDDSKTMKVIKVHPDEIQHDNVNSDWVFKKTDYVENSNSQSGGQNSQNGGLSQSTQANKKPQRSSGGVDQVTPGRINSFPGERDSRRNGRVDGNFRRQKREAEKVRDLNNVLYEEMINEDVNNFENCDCNRRDTRDEGNFQKHCNCATKQKRHAEQEHYDKLYYNPETYVYQTENMEEETAPNYQSKANYFYDEAAPQQNPYVNNQTRDAVPDHTSEVNKSSLSTEGKEVKNAESTSTNLNLRKNEDEHQHNETRPIKTINDSTASKSTLVAEEKKEKNVELTTPANISSQKMENEYERDVNHPLEMINNPIFDEIPQIVIYSDTKNQPISGQLDETEQKVYEAITPSIENSQTNVASQQKSVGKVNTELDKHSTSSTYPKQETERVPESTTQKIQHSTARVNTNKENVTTEKPQITVNKEERKESTPSVYAKEAEYEHQTSNPVKKDTIYATAIPSLVHQDVVTENTPNLKMKGQFISQSKASSKYSELGDKPEESFAEKADHVINTSSNPEIQDMIKSTNPSEQPISHIIKQFPRPNGENPEIQMQPQAKIKRQSKKESTELFRGSEDRTEEMASALQESTTVPEGSTPMSLEKMSTAHLDQHVPLSKNLQESQKTTPPLDESSNDHEDLNIQIPNPENMQPQKTSVPEESTSIDNRPNIHSPHSENLQKPQKPVSTSEKLSKVKNPEPPLTEDFSSAIADNNTGPSAGRDSMPLEMLSDPHATSSPSVKTDLCVKTIQNGTKFTIYTGECATKSSVKDEEDAKSYAPTTLLAARSSVLRDKVRKSEDIEQASALPEMGRDESEIWTGQTVQAGTEFKQVSNENSVGTSTGNTPGQNFRVEKSGGKHEVAAEKLGIENGTLTENSVGEKKVTKKELDGGKEPLTEKSDGEQKTSMQGELTKKSSPETGAPAGDYSATQTLALTKNFIPTDATERNIASTEKPDTENTLKEKVTLPQKTTKNLNEHNLASTRKSNPISTSSRANSLKVDIASKNSTKAKPEKKSSIPELVKGCRSSTRSEALLALKRENDDKRARRLAEYIKYQEYQRKRAAQLDELRQKMRQKQESIMQKYKADLLALKKSFNDAGRNLKRRDALQDMVEDDLTGFADPEKPMYVQAYNPIDYELEKDAKYQRTEAGKRILLPVVEVERPLLAMRERILLPNDYLRGYRDLHVVNCASCSMPRNSAGPLTYIDNEDNARRMYRYLDSMEAPWVFEYDQKPRRNVYRDPQIYDQSDESFDLDGLHLDLDESSEPKKSARIREIVAQGQTSKSGHPNSLGVEYLQRLQTEIPESSSDEEAASVEYEEYEDEKMHDDEVSGSVSDGKGAENRPIVYLFDSKQPEKMPSDVYEQSVRALLNILAQRGIDRDMVQSTEARNSSKNKRSPRNDSVGVYSPSLPNGVKEDGAETEIEDNMRAAPNEETNRRKRRAINNWMLIDPDNVETSKKFDSTLNTKNRVRVDAESEKVEQNINSLPKISHDVQFDADSIEISKRLNSLFKTSNRVRVDDDFVKLEKNMNIPRIRDHRQVDADPIGLDKTLNLLPKISIMDSGKGINRDVQRHEQDFSDNKQSRMNEIDPDEDLLFREHFQRKVQLLKEVREPKNDLIKRLNGDAEEQEAKMGPTSAIENTLPAQDGTAGEFEKAQNLTGSLDEFVENFQGNSNGTLTDDERKRVNGNGSSSIHRAFDSMVVNISRLFSFLCHIVRILQG